MRSFDQVRQTPGRLIETHSRRFRPHNSIVHQAYSADYLPGIESSPLYNKDDVKVRSCASLPDRTRLHQKRNHFVNADGMGVAWYNNDPAGDVLDVAATFKATTPAWSNENLNELAEVTWLHWYRDSLSGFFARR